MGVLRGKPSSRISAFLDIAFNILRELFKNGIKLGISSRGMGSVETIEEADGSPTTKVGKDFELIAFDFVSNPSTDRKAATSALAASVGAKVTQYSGLRGKYDFMAVIEGTFEQAAAAAMVAVSSGAVSDFTILEDVDLNEIAKTAQKMASSYKEPGK